MSQDEQDQGQGQEGPQEPQEAPPEAEQHLLGPGGRWQPPPPPGEDQWPSTTDLLTRMSELVQVSVGQHRMGERVEYLISGGILPQADGGLVPVIGVTLAIPSHIVGQRIHGTSVIPDLWMQAKGVEEMVSAMLESLRDSRSRAMNGLGPESDFPG